MMEDRDSRFNHLLKPIRELADNWSVNIASYLEDYLEEVENFHVSIDGGKTTLNFAEAALLIQGSACIYSKKVEYLHDLVSKTLSFISKQRGSSIAVNEKKSDEDEEDEEENSLKATITKSSIVSNDFVDVIWDDDPEFLSLDDVIEESNNINMKTAKSKKKTGCSEEDETWLIQKLAKKSNTTPNASILFNQFLSSSAPNSKKPRLSTCTVDNKTGTLLIQGVSELDQQQLPVAIKPVTAVTTATSMNISNDFVDHFDDHFDDVASHPNTSMQDSQSQKPVTRSKAKDAAQNKKAADRLSQMTTVMPSAALGKADYDFWKLLDPFDTAECATSRKLQTGKTFTAPKKSSECIDTNKKQKHKYATIYGWRVYESDQNKTCRVMSKELSVLSRMNKGKASKISSDHKDEPTENRPTINESFHMADDGYDDICNNEGVVDEMEDEKQEEHKFVDIPIESFSPDPFSDNIGATDSLLVPTSLAKQESMLSSSSVSSYEDFCRRQIDKFRLVTHDDRRQSDGYFQSSSKSFHHRIADWQMKMEFYIENEVEARGKFDLLDTGDGILKKVKSSGSKLSLDGEIVKNEGIHFIDILESTKAQQETKSWMISRNFLAILQLASSGSVAISKSTVKDDFIVTACDKVGATAVENFRESVVNKKQAKRKKMRSGL